MDHIIYYKKNNSRNPLKNLRTHMCACKHVLIKISHRESLFFEFFNPSHSFQHGYLQCVAGC